jgi:RNA polymerase sigma factor (sigma-70 family)
MTEAQLASQVMDGSPTERAAAERDLCAQLAPRLHLFALRRLRCYADAADVTQETLAVLVDALRNRKLDDVSKVAQFALGISRHLVFGVLRGERLRRGLQTVADPHGQSPPPELWNLDLPKLLACLAKLESRSRDIVGQTFYEGRSADEIATSTGLSTGNVRVIRHRALLQLRACVDGVEASAP